MVRCAPDAATHRIRASKQQRQRANGMWTVMTERQRQMAASRQCQVRMRSDAGMHCYGSRPHMASAGRHSTGQQLHCGSVRPVSFLLMQCKGRREGPLPPTPGHHPSHTAGAQALTSVWLLGNMLRLQVQLTADCCLPLAVDLSLYTAS